MNFTKKDTATVKIDAGVVNEDLEESIEVPPPSRKESNRLRKEKRERQNLKDKFPQPNKDGRFYYALAKAQTNNEDINAYLLGITQYEISPSPALIASGFMQNLTDAEILSWENRLLVIVEIYLPSLIYNELMNK